MNVNDDDEPSNLAQVIDAIREGAPAIARVLVALRPPAPKPTNVSPEAAPSAELGALLTKSELARAWRVSASTIDRFSREGMQHEPCGNRRRYDLEKCNAWRAARGSKPTTPAGDVDVGPALRRGGLVVEKRARHSR